MVYPIVRLHLVELVPSYVEWTDPWTVINKCLMTLINLGHFVVSRNLSHNAFHTPKSPISESSVTFLHRY